ncbi:hypothetical protein ACFL6O_04680 [candidate division KSB1 bacterium]
MDLLKRLKNYIIILAKLSRYNLKIIFADRFIYFAASSFIVYLAITLILFFNSEGQISEAHIFWTLLVPGVLMIFYPVTFNIQNDVDKRMVDILFGIPNYRFKIWLFKLLIMFFIAYIMLLLLGFLSSYAVVDIPVFKMGFHVLIPVIFISSMIFMISTIVGDGNGTAVIVLLLGIGIWIGREFFQNYPRWDIFLNPFVLPANINELVWEGIITGNRVYLVILSLFAIMLGLLNLQKRERFLY